MDYDVSPEYVNAEGTFCRYKSTYYDIIGQWILYYDAAGGLAGGQLLRIPFADLDSPEVLLDFQDERIP